MYCAVNVGERIRYFRNLRGWSQETLALQAEINPAFLGHLERGSKALQSKRWRKSSMHSTFRWPSFSPTRSLRIMRKKPSLHRYATRSAISRSTIWNASTQSSVMFWRLGNKKFSAYNITNEVDIICPPRLFCDISCFGYSCCPLLTV